MKKITHISIITAFLFTISACNQSPTSLENATKLYTKSIENNDAALAKVALNQILLYDSTNHAYQDSLSRIYISAGNFEAGLKYAELVYSSGNASNKLKENMALAYQQVGETEKAEKFVSNLFEDTRDHKYLYQTLVIQYENGNQILFDSISNQILDLSTNDSLVAKTLVQMPGPVSGVSQQVPIKAATLFLIGNNALERKQDVNTAVKYLRQSIEEYDQFEMPRYVLMELEKMMMSQRR